MGSKTKLVSESATEANVSVPSISVQGEKPKRKIYKARGVGEEISAFSFGNLNVFLLIVGRDRQTDRQITHCVATHRNSNFIL